MQNTIVGASAMRQATVWLLNLETVTNVRQAPNIQRRHPRPVTAHGSHEMGFFKHSKPTRPEGGALGHMPPLERWGEDGLESPIGLPGLQVHRVSRGVKRPCAHDIPRRQDQGPRWEAGELGNSHYELGATPIAGAGARKRMGLPPGPGAVVATAATPFMAQQAGESFPITTPSQATLVMLGGPPKEAGKRLVPRLVGADVVLQGVDKRQELADDRPVVPCGHMVSVPAVGFW